MPARMRAHTSRTTSRPYDRRSPTASPARQENLPTNVPLASPIQVGYTDADQNPDGDADTPPDRPGLPTYAEYKHIETNYLRSLSPRKRDKALITQTMFDKIWDVLHQPDACTVETPQFRFWVRKMFTLSRPVGSGWDGAGDGCFIWSWGEERVHGMGMGAGAGMQQVPEVNSEADSASLELERSVGIEVGRATTDEPDFSAVVLHENRPVAIMEQLYELFCYCHVRAGHGGRDKTCAVIREHYSWVPKELTAQFVKACPTCTLKRSGHTQGAAGAGTDVGILAPRRRVGHTGKKGQTIMPSEAGVKDTPQTGLLGLGWPTTGGPLDPANPEPCGVLERERERLRAHGDGGLVCSPGSRMLSVLGEVASESSVKWSNTPPSRTLTLGHPFTVNDGTTRRSDQEEKEKSPTKTELPSLVSALSNESLDQHVSFIGLEPGNAAECPLRLLGPLFPGAELDLAEPSYLFQIDPVLLSFDYPGLGPPSESCFASDPVPDAAHPGPSTKATAEAHDVSNLPDCDLYRLCASSKVGTSVPALEPSLGSDSPDSSFERTMPYVTTDAAGTEMLPLSLSTELIARSPCGSRYDYRDGALTMLCACSTDEVGHELDESLPFSIMTDAS